jgi:hypothetical protein
MILLGVLYRHHILNTLNDTNGRNIPARVSTDGTRIRIADIMACVTVLHFTLQLTDSVCKLFYILRILTEHPQHQSQGGLASDTWQLREFRHCLL